MALHLKTAREARKYVATQPAKTPTKRPVCPVEATEREKPGTAQGEVSHTLVRTLRSHFDMPPAVGSPALCVWDGRRWQCVVYAEVGDRRFSLREETFRKHFEEAEA